MAAASRCGLWRRPRSRASSRGGGRRRTWRQPPSSSTSRRSILGDRRTPGRRSRSASRSQMLPRRSRSPATWARASPSSPGAVRTRRMASGDRMTSVVAASAGPARLPSYASTPTGMSPPSASSTSGARAIASPRSRDGLDGKATGCVGGRPRPVRWWRPRERSAARAVEGRGDDPGRRPGAADVDDDLVARLDVGPQEGQRDAPAEHRRDVPAGHDPHLLAVEQHRAVGPGRPPALDLEAPEAAADAALALGEEGVVAEGAALAPGDDGLEAGLQRRDAGAELVAVQREPGLEPQRVAGAEPRGGDTGRQDRVPDPGGARDGDGDLDAVLPRVARPGDDAGVPEHV